MFEANKKLDDDDEEGGKPSFGVVVSMGKHKPAFSPSAKLDDDDESEEMDGNARAREACEIMAKMFNAGRVDAEKLDECLGAYFKARESEPHEEGEHTNEKEGY